MEEAKDNELKLTMLIEMEQSDSNGRLSRYRSKEDLEYPTLTNSQANQISMDINMIVKAAVADYIRGLADEKKERVTKELAEVEEKANKKELPPGAIR